MLDTSHLISLKSKITALGLGVLSLFGATSARADLIEGVPLRGFSDISYLYENLNQPYPGQDRNNSFKLAPVTFFLAKPVDKKVNFLLEMGFEPNSESVGIDLERIYLQYTVDPWLKIAAGRFHTGLGYWNETYHHGTYLHTSVTRPVMERFEDGGGLLPVHTVGLEFRGNGLVAGGNFGYVANIGNGRGPKSDPPTNVLSYNRSKALSFVGYYEFSNGFRFGPGVYYSQLPGGSNIKEDRTFGTDVGPRGGETILSGHAVYNSPSIEVLAEYAHLIHNYDVAVDNVDTAGNAFENTKIEAFYAQFGYHWGQFTPYFRYELNAPDKADSYLTQLAVTHRYYTAGVRYELTSGTALKLEYEKRSQSGGPSDDWGAKLNWSFGW